MEVITYFYKNGTLNETFNGTVCDPSFNLTICKQEINATYCEGLKNQTECNTDTPEAESPLRRILTALVSVTIGIAMVGMGCGVEIPKMKEHLIKPTGVIVGLLCQFIIMPAIAFILAKIFQMADLQTLALLIMGSCPGGSASNIMAYWADGDLDLSITMTTVSSILGLGMMPLLLWIYSFGFANVLRVPFKEIGITLASLIIPIGIGIAIGYKFPRQAPKIVKILSTIGIIALIIVAIVAFATYGGSLELTSSQYACAAIFPLVGMLLGYSFSSLISLYSPLYLHHYQRRTISLETGIQNTQLAAAIIQLSGFSVEETGKIILFPICYLVAQLGWVIILLLPYRVYVRCHKKFHSSSGVANPDPSKPENNEASKKDNGNYNPAFDPDIEDKPK